MTAINGTVRIFWLALAGALIGLPLGGIQAIAQSPVVFMTSNYPASVRKLVRFDYGTESFGISGASALPSLTSYNGNVLVSDLNAGVIRRYAPNGTSLANFATIASPMEIESDRSGNVYATHGTAGPDVATRFNSAGVVTQSFSFAGTDLLTGIDADAAGNVYVCDREYQRVIKFAANGTMLATVSVPGKPEDLAIDEVGNRMYVADSGLRIIDISSAVPQLIGSITVPPLSSIIAVDFAEDSGNILVADNGPSHPPRGLEFSPAGVLLQQYQPSGASSVTDIVSLPVPEAAFGLIVVTALLGVVVARPRRFRPRTHVRL